MAGGCDRGHGALSRCSAQISSGAGAGCRFWLAAGITQQAAGEQAANRPAPSPQAPAATHRPESCGSRRWRLASAALVAAGVRRPTVARCSARPGGTAGSTAPAAGAPPAPRRRMEASDLAAALLRAARSIRRCDRRVSAGSCGSWGAGVSCGRPPELRRVSTILLLRGELWRDDLYLLVPGERDKNPCVPPDQPACCSAQKAPGRA